MRNKIKNKITIYFCLFILVLSSIACSFLSDVTIGVGVASVTDAEKLFKYDDISATVSGNKVIPNIADMKYNDENRGVLVEAKKSGTVVEFANEMSGMFSLDFRVYSAVTMTKDFDKLYFDFADTESDRTFSILFDQAGFGYSGYGWVKATADNDPQAHSFTHDAAKESDNIIRGDNESPNNALFHTTSFCNTVDSTYDSQAQFWFDPSSMELRAQTQNNIYCLMDFDKPSHVKSAQMRKGAFVGFNKYKVSIRFEDVSPGKRAKLMLYQLNGQSLAGADISKNNTAGPALAANPSVKGVVGLNYDLVKPLAYDIVDGYVDYVGTPTITSPSGTAITPVNFKFTPTEKGEYVVKYPGIGTLDLKSRAAKDISTKILVLEEKPVTVIKVTGIDNMTIANNVNVSFPKASCSNELALGVGKLLPVKFTITKQDSTTPLIVVDDISEKVDYKFTELGTYIASYQSTEIYGKVIKSDYIVIVSSSAPTFIVDSYDRVVARNTNFAVPKAVAVLNGINYETISKVTFPTGEETSAATIDLQIVGTYTITYTYSAAGVAYKFDTYFEVFTKPISLFENVKDSVIQQNTDSPDYAKDWDNKTPYNGIKVTAKKNGAQVKYNNIINLADNKSNDVLVEYLITPDQKLKLEMSRIQFRFVDVYDPTNYMTIMIANCGDINYDYISLAKTSAKGNVLTGIVWGAPTTSTFNGTNTTTNFIGREYITHSSMHSGKIFYDNTTKKVSVSFNATQNEVLDLDDPKHVGTGNEWRGFTTGEVYMTASVVDIASSTASYMLLNIDGQSMSGEFVSSNVKPMFRLNMLNNSTVPEGLVGTAYPIFETEVVDPIDGRLPYTQNVYYNYGKDNQREVPIVNRSFVPTEVGEVTLVTRTANASNEMIIPIKSSLDELKYNFRYQPAKTAKVGESVVIPAGDARGGSGDKKIMETKVYRKTNKKEVAVYNNIFDVLEQGVYVVEVKVTDYLKRSITNAYEVKVEYSRTPILVNEIPIPKAIQLNKEITFPLIIAKDFYTIKGEAKETFVEIEVTDKNGVTVKLDETRKYVPKEQGKIKVKYTASSKINKANFIEKEYEINVISPSFKSEYFYTNNEVSSSDTEDYGDFSTFEEGADLEFINTLYAGEFIFTFQIPEASANYESLDIVLTDSQNADIKVVLNVYKGAEKTPFGINGDVTGALAGIFGDADKTFLVKYNGATHQVTNKENAVAGEIKRTFFGKDFSGFPSGKIYLNLKFNGLDKDSQAGIQVRGINGQNFDSLEGDLKAPNLVLDSPVVKDAEFGSVVLIPFATAYDVLDSNASVVVSLLAPGGKTIFKDKPLTEGLSFIADKYGKFTLEYKPIDSSNNSTRVSYTITVTDNIAPVIVIEGDMPKTAKLNVELALPKITVTDNNDKNLKLYAYYINPNSKMLAIANGKFTPTQKGTYEIWLYAKDSSFSYTFLKYSIVVD